jgi:hypothetical protein
VTLRDSEFGFRLGRFSWVRLGQPRRKQADWDSRRVGRRLEVGADKIHFWMVDFKFSFDLCTSTYRVSVLSLFGFSAALFESVLNAGNGRGWRLPG